MNNIGVLDCTLRDGGYCNKWIFGRSSKDNIVKALVQAGIDVIECGYLSYAASENEDSTIYPSLELANNSIRAYSGKRFFTIMINYGDFPIEYIPDYRGEGIEGIRVAFHKNDRIGALDYCRQLKKKGYKVFIQGMVTINYTVDEFVDLIERSNDIVPYAFYIVDSFGNMRTKELIKFYQLTQKYLKKEITVGFHSHNNLQLAYSNASLIVNECGNRSTLIDSSIYGMGRGAGNLNTELLIDFLKERCESRYDLYPLLDVMDKIMDVFYKKNKWGYSIPNYLSAKNNTHPNYAEFLNNRKTLTVRDMENIFQLIEEDRKCSYDEDYIEKLYIQYMSKESVDDGNQCELNEELKDRTIILIAPGKSAGEEKGVIDEKVADPNSITISINHVYDGVNVDYVFISNIRRYKEMGDTRSYKRIITSNIKYDGECYRANYSELLSEGEGIEDNAGLMAINFLKKYQIKELLLAGFDGYSYEISDNYADENMTLALKKEVIDKLNKGVSLAISKLSKDVDIKFLTQPRHINFVNI